MENITLKEKIFNGESVFIIMIISHIQFYLVLFLKFFLIKKRKHSTLKQQRKKETDYTLNGNLITMAIMEIIIMMKNEGKGVFHSIASPSCICPFEKDIFTVV